MTSIFDQGALTKWFSKSKEKAPTARSGEIQPEWKTERVGQSDSEFVMSFTELAEVDGGRKSVTSKQLNPHTPVGQSPQPELFE